jgi:hypothetical protein
MHPVETLPKADALHPADELNLVRAQMRRLKAREAALRARLIEGEDRAGKAWVAELRERRARRIDPARLPLSARADPRSWLGRRSLAVVLRPRPEAAAEVPAPALHQNRK